MAGAHKVKLLLDTHIWLWALLEPGRLSPDVAHALEDSSNELWLSPISVWEALLLAERGRIEVDRDPRRWADALLDALPLRDASLSREAALASRTVPLDHQDPADRFIAATALVNKLVLVTGDQRLASLTEPQILVN